MNAENLFVDYHWEQVAHVRISHVVKLVIFVLLPGSTLLNFVGCSIKLDCFIF